VTVYIEDMENEVEHFPQLIDDNGFDTYPTFVNYYAPGRVTNFGSAIPKTKVGGGPGRCVERGNKVF
jgi:hypothetical protein